jgi:hypothetical protein
MSTFKDITYKKNNDETWAEWSKRVPDNDQDKLDYIGEYIYEYTVWGGKGREITDLLLGIGVEGLIPLLESEELLDAKIEDAYTTIQDFNKMRKEIDDGYGKDDEPMASLEDEEEEYKKPVKPVTTLTVAEMIEALSKLPPYAKLVITESGFYSDVEFAEVMLPEPYTVGTRKTDYNPDMPDGTQVYRIGHSKQWY